MVDWSRRNYKGRHAFLVTLHQKERVIAPILRDVGLQVSPCCDVDTDQFGTFSGERDRVGSAIDAARGKIAAGFARGLGAIGLASEGSFGPDPHAPFVPLGREIVLFSDAETGLEIVGIATDLQPNFHHECVSTTKEAVIFAQRVGFPRHGVIVSGSRNGRPYPGGLLFKEIVDIRMLHYAVEQVLEESEAAFLQTDMRAHRNPTRMKAIGLATEDLARRLESRCPDCRCPGYDITEWRRGRPCDWCGLATRMVEFEILTCQNCGHREECRAAGPDRVEPALCEHCNP